MDKKKTHKRSKPKRAMESDSTSNNTTTTQDAETPQNSGKKTIRIAGAQLNATSTDTLTTKDISEEQGSSSSGHSLHRSSSGVEKTKHVSFEDFGEKSGSTSSSQSKSSESSLRSSKSTTAAAATAEGGGGGITMSTVSKTILRKRKKNAKRRAKKIASQAMSAIQMDESTLEKKVADDSENIEPIPTQETAQKTLKNEPKLRFSDEVLQIAERPVPAHEEANTSSAYTSSARQLQLDMADGTFVPENIEIAARFKQIMDMFDNFTKNLESLELPHSPRDEVDAQALTKKIHKKSAIPLGWKGDDDISCNVGSNIDISITENADREKKEDITADVMKETLLGQTAVKDIKVAALPKAELRESAVLPTIPQKCEIRDWQTGVRQSVVKEFENKINMQSIQDPQTLQNIAKEKMMLNSNLKKDNFQKTPTSDISIHVHEISAKNHTQNAEEIKIQEISFKVPAAPAMVEIKIVPEAPKHTDTILAPATATMQADEVAQVCAGNKDFEVDKTSKQTKVEVNTTQETILNESTPEKVMLSGDCLKAPKSENTDFVIEMEGNEYPEKDFLTEEFEIWKMHQNIYPTGLPKWRQGLQTLASANAKKLQDQQLTKEAAVPAMLIQKDIATSTAPDDGAVDALTELSCQTVSCQTSLHLHTTATDGNTTTDTAAITKTVSNLADSHLIDDPASNAQMQNTVEMDYKVETYLVMPPPDEMKTCASLGPSISRQALVKESPSLMDLPRVMAITQQPERTFHTIHIDTTSTPSPSVMQRPPLGQRCWTVITDLFSAICVCLQVNKDCIFCLGFFIAFVVSASFLTAFFYRTLSISPQIMHPPQPHAHVQTISTHGNNMYYY